MIYTPASGQAFYIVVKSIAPLEIGTGYKICSHGVPGMLFVCAIIEIHRCTHRHTYEIGLLTIAQGILCDGVVNSFHNDITGHCDSEITVTVSVEISLSQCQVISLTL